MKFIEAKIYNYDLEEGEETILINVANIAWIADTLDSCYIEMNYGNDPYQDVLTAVILLTSCATCDLAKDHTPGLSCPPADGSHGPCPFGCEPIVKR